ncbi:MAG TPA: NAD(P)-dependent alcohol dehydrogenase [Caulobacter sp.]|nr:NAD(P)-dependent alcohol dehydrogenase [Caulobacter sp.]
MPYAVGYAAQDAASPLAAFHFERRALRPDDVRIDILYCGVCHSDLHTARNDWGGTIYPCCPGHEIVGRVSAVGPQVRRFREGDLAAVGCLVDSCMDCDQCRKGEEQLCRNRSTGTYNGKDRITGDPTFGGYSDHIVVREAFVLKIPDGLDVARAAPLLCAGITTYSPLKTWKAGPGTRLGVAGLGGLGHMAVKFGVAMGCEVTVITGSESKRSDAQALGAQHVLLSSDRDAMKAARNGFDLIIDTIPVAHKLQPYLPLLDIDGSLVIVGAIDELPPFHSGLLLGGRRRVSGSPIGGIAETQEMLDFCAARGVLPECEQIAIQDINHAYERMERSDVKYRFVIDMASLAKERAAA